MNDSSQYLDGTNNFNLNEKKYLYAKNVLIYYKHNFFVNYRITKKISNGDYILSGGTSFSTIQSLVTYTTNYYQDISNYLDSLIDSSIIKRNQDFVHSVFDWIHNGEVWASHTPVYKEVYIRKKYWHTLMDVYKLQPIEVKLIIAKRLKELKQIDDYDIIKSEIE